MVNEKFYSSYTDFRDIEDGIYSFNVNTTDTVPEEYKQPPMDIGDGIIIIKSYSAYQKCVALDLKELLLHKKILERILL